MTFCLNVYIDNTKTLLNIKVIGQGHGHKTRFLDFSSLRDRAIKFVNMITCEPLHFLDPWFIQHPRCIGPHVDAMSVCLEPMLQPLPRLIPFFVDPGSLYLSSLSLVYQVFSWILQLPIVGLASECVLHPFLWHYLAIVVFFPGSHSLILMKFCVNMYLDNL